MNTFDKVPAFFEQVGTKVQYSKGDFIIYADDQIRAIYFLLKGKAKQYAMSEEGREKIFFILEPGDIVGDISMFEERKAGFYVEAIEDTVLLHLTLSNLQEALRKYPEYNMYILSSLSKKASSRITFRTSQQFISDMLGINRITAVKIIKNLKMMGLLDVKGNIYIINDLSLLKMYSLKDC